MTKPSSDKDPIAKPSLTIEHGVGVVEQKPTGSRPKARIKPRWAVVRFSSADHRSWFVLNEFDREEAARAWLAQNFSQWDA
jgi:hypothetical protein